MRATKGFTLIEIVVVLVIIGVLVSIAAPNFVVIMEQTKAQTAKNNLLAIAAAQQRFFEAYGYYCSDQLPQTTCGTSLSNLNTNLRLNMQANDSFSYSCLTASLSCEATDGVVTLETTGAGVDCTLGGIKCPSD